jgi:hypothetical protein
VIGGDNLFARFVRGFFRVPERLAPAEWVEKYIRLPAGQHERSPGPVRLRRWMREILNCLAELGVVDILFSGPTQEGKTFLLRMAVAFKIAGRPGPAMWLDSTVPKVRSIFKKQIRPLVEANPILAKRLPRDRHHITNTEILFPGAALNGYGANSDKQVAGDTAECVFGNEGAKWKLETDDEAAILELVRHRTEQYGDTRKHLFSSTPRTEANLFWKEVEKGDKRRWFVPCPHCGHMQALEWGDESSRHGVKWDPAAKLPDGSWDLDRVKASARYRCANAACPGAPWDDAARLAAVEDPRAEWRGSKRAAPGYRSYCLNGLYGRNDSRRLGNLAVKFLSSRLTGFLMDRQDFWNSDMGEVWRRTIESVNVKKLAHLEADYLRGELPAGFKPDLLIMGVDVQRDRLRFVLRALAWNGQSYLVDFGWRPTWKDLDTVEKDYRALGGHWHAIVDINFEDRRQEVREQVYARRGRGWMLADGQEFTDEGVKLDRENVFLGGKGAGAQHYALRLIISTYDFKCELEAKRSGEVKNWWLCRLPTALERLAVGEDPREIEEYAEYKKEILDEKRQPRARRQKSLPDDEFVARTGANHAWDCEVYILALFRALWLRRSAKQRQKDRAAGGARTVAEVAKT